MITRTRLHHLQLIVIHELPVLFCVHDTVFRVIPMYQISKRSMQAVTDAFTCRPPALDGEVRDDEEDSLSQTELTAYWSKKDMSQVSDNLME